MPGSPATRAASLAHRHWHARHWSARRRCRASRSTARRDSASWTPAAPPVCSDSRNPRPARGRRTGSPRRPPCRSWCRRSTARRPRAPRHVGGRAAQRRTGIGEARPVHVQPQAQFAAHRRQRVDFGQRIDLPRLGRLGDRHRAGFREVDVRPAGGERTHRVGGQLAVLGLRDKQLRSVGEESGAPHSSVSTCAEAEQMTL